MRRAGIIALALFVVTTVFVITAGAGDLRGLAPLEERSRVDDRRTPSRADGAETPYGIAAAAHESARGARIAELERLRDAIILDLTIIRDELAAQADAAMVARRPLAAGSSSSPGSYGGGGSCPGTWAVPDAIVWREARCRRDAYNADGCVTATGRGCFGPYQISHEHYESGGRCAGMDPWSPPQQDACANELKAVAGLSPWSTG